MICRGCDLDKPESEMARLGGRRKDGATDDRYSQYCRECYNTKRITVRKTDTAYQKQWRDKNADHAREYQRNWRRQRFEEMRERALTLLGGACVECGNDDHRVLEFDHINGGGTAERKVRDRIAAMTDIATGKRTDIQLLCANCHRIKTYHQAPASTT
jgi:hypothetical protein